MPCPHIAPTRQPATSHNLLLQLLRPRLVPMALPPKYRRRHTTGRAQTHTHTNDGRAPAHFVSEGSNTHRFPGPYTAKASKVAATSLSSCAATKLPTPPSSTCSLPHESVFIHRRLFIHPCASLLHHPPAQELLVRRRETPSIHGAPSIRVGPLDERRRHSSVHGWARLNRLDSIVEGPIPEQDQWAIYRLPEFRSR